MHISALTGKTLKRLQSFAPMLYAKDECCINNNGDNSRIIGREREREREREGERSPFDYSRKVYL